MKPSDVLQLLPLELKELYEQTFRLHTVEFSGSLQALKNRLDRGHVKPVRRNKGESWKWELMPSVNRKADTYGTTLDLTEDVNQPESLEVNKWNQVYALLHPSFYFTTHAEPAVLVSKYTGSLDDLLDESLQCAWCVDMGDKFLSGDMEQIFRMLEDFMKKEIGEPEDPRQKDLFQDH